MNKNAKKYYRELKILLPLRAKKEFQLFRNIKARLTELTTLDPNATYEELCTQLGTPLDIITEYYSNCDTTYIAKKLQFSRYIRILSVCSLLALLILSGLRAYYLHQALEATKESVVTYSIEYIH